MDMTPGSKHNDEHDEAQKKVFRGYGFRPGRKNMILVWVGNGVVLTFVAGFVMMVILLQ